ncbi:MAG TPA: hypothetical protein VM141_09295 [Planctomycetota bacterium]|nr:hypothetical protein [Planctomycetota bacterium]
MLSGVGHAIGQDRNLEGARHVVNVDIVGRSAVPRDAVDRTFEELARDETIEAAHHDGKGLARRVQFSFVGFYHDANFSDARAKVKQKPATYLFVKPRPLAFLL